MLKLRTMILFVLPILLIIGLSLSVAGNEKPVELPKTSFVPVGGEQIPNEMPQHEESFVPLVDEGDPAEEPQYDQNELDRITSKTSYMVSSPAYMKSVNASFLFEDFEDAFPPTDWTLTSTHTDTTTWHQNSVSPYNGVYAADCKYDENLVPQDEWLISPSMDFTAATGDLKVSFWWNMSYYWGVDPFDNYNIELYAIVGATQTLLWDESAAGVFENFIYYEAVVSLAAYIGEADVKLAWRYVGVDGAQAKVDFVSVNDDASPMGRCCYGDPFVPTCADLNQLDCEGTADYISWSQGLDCTTPCPVATAGDDCTAPYVVTLPADLPFEDLSQTNCGRGDVYEETDMGYYDNGEDMIYEITVTSQVYVDILLDPKGTTYSGLGIFDDCPDVGNLLMDVGTSSSDPKGFGILLPAGTYYLMVDTWSTPDCIPDFDLTIAIGTEPVGRCCYGDPIGTMCDDVIASECATLGGVWTADVNCTDNPCVVVSPGDDCTDPYEVKLPGDMPFVNSSYTCGRGNTYETTCLGSYDSGEDMIYWLDVDSPIDIDIHLTSATTYTGFAIGTMCPLEETGCVIVATGSATNADAMGVHLEPGSYYLMVDTWASPDCIDEFTLTIEAASTGNPGDNCGNPLEVKMPGDLPLTTIDSTCSRLDYYENTCMGYYDGGDDIIYELDVDSPATFKFTLDPMGTTYAGMGLSDMCPLDETTCLASVTSSSSDPKVMEAYLEPGLYYLQIDTWASPQCIPEFTLDIEVKECDIPANDLCEDVTPVTVPLGTSVTFNGDNTCATANCPVLFDSDGYTWEAFTITEKMNVYVDYCGSSPANENGFTELMIGCPCDDVTSVKVMATSFDATTCPDGNFTLFWDGLDAGTYYYPIMVDYAYPSTEGPYTINVTTEEWIPHYCDADGGCDEYIENVTFGAINNTTGCDNYGDYTALTAYISEGVGYPFSMTLGNGYSSDYGAVWIDWNQDFDFDDADEEIILDVNTGAGPYSGTINVPAGAMGGMTRMRVRLNYSSYPGPCGTTSYGEVEDYTVLVGGEAAEFTVDPTALDFGLVEQDATGSGSLTLGCVGTYDIDFSADISYFDNYNNPNAYAGLGTTKPEKAPYNGPANVPTYDKQGGEDVGTALVIGGLPYVDAGTTDGYADDYDEACTWSSTSPDVVYSFTPAADVTVDVDLCNSAYDTKLFLYENSVTAGAPFACNDDNNDVCGSGTYRSAILELALTGGNTYYIVVDGYDGEFGDYELNMVEWVAPDGRCCYGDVNAPSCTDVTQAVCEAMGDYISWGAGLDCTTPCPTPFECPAGSIAEAEACGDDTNGGCNSTPNAYDDIICGDTICGTIWADASSRDTDWFKLVLYNTETVTITGTAEFLFIMGFVDTADCGLAAAVDPYAVGNAGDLVSVSRTCGPGEYWIFVSHQEYEGNPCGLQNGYWFTAECEGGDPPIEWLSLPSASGSVPAGGTMPFTVNYDVAGLENGVYTADITFTHTGAKGTTVVPVSIEVGETGTNILTVNPDPMYAFMEYPYEDMSAMFYLGGEFAGGGYVVEDVETCPVNGLTPLSLTILESMEGYTGHVMQIEIDIVEFIGAYPLLWDVTTQTYTIDIGFVGGGTGVETAEVTMIGHTSGDANFDGALNILDVTYTIMYIYQGGPEPQPIMGTADTNGDGLVNILDITKTIMYLYKGGEAVTHP